MAVAGILLAGAFFSFLRALVPRLRALRLAREAKKLTERVTLEGGEPDALRIRDARGQSLVLDTRNRHHPDAALATRVGPAWMARSRDPLETVAVRDPGGR